MLLPQGEGTWKIVMVFQKYRGEMPNFLEVSSQNMVEKVKVVVSKG